MNIIRFGYSRKSTESDERQTQSIDDQNNWIINKVGGKPFILFSESKSAKDPNKRIEFQKLIKEIEKTKVSKVILYSWKLDRLSRNPVDSGYIQYLMQRGKLDKIITNDREYTPVDAGLLMSVENAMSNQFILDMVKNVERGMKSKIEKGGCIQNVPLGYINNKETKQADVDSNYAPYIKEIFNLRANGSSLNDIVEVMYQKGLRSKVGKKITKSSIDQILKNPFYIGLQKFRGELHKSVHKKIVSVELWNKVNATKRGYKKHNANIEFPLKGIVKNYHTKKTLLALWKKEKYIYYSTHSREEFNINMNQDHIIKAFEPYIKKYTIPEYVKPFIIEEIRGYFEVYYKELKDKRNTLLNNIKGLEKKSERLFDLVLKGTIEDEKYKEEKNKLMINKKQLEEELSNIQDFDSFILDETKELVELLTNLSNKRNNGDIQTKLLIIKLIVVELFIDTKKQLYIQEKELFELIKVQYGFKWQGP